MDSCIKVYTYIWIWPIYKFSIRCIIVRVGTYVSPSVNCNCRTLSFSLFLSSIKRFIYSTAIRQQHKWQKQVMTMNLHFWSIIASLRWVVSRAGTTWTSCSNPILMLALRFCSEAMWFAFFCSSLSSSWGAFLALPVFVPFS